TSSREPMAKKKDRAEQILDRLEEAYPDWGPTLDFKTPFELLVATILAAQNTDENVNRVTKDLFKKYRKPADYLAVPVEELEKDIYKTGFFRQKAKSIRAVCEALIAEHGGKMPDTMEALTGLRGVGRKTASIVLGAAYEKPAIGVDTHVDRVARRLELAPPDEDDREAIEAALKAAFPEKDWIKLNWLLILHGRRRCTAKKPDCPACPVSALCPWPGKTGAAPAPAKPRPRKRS
ncbi:MAG TPA: endonuclease III, partial [Planctomycetota bacterium]|nr:endonuclease III [Planctomycetota bacterium]